MDQNQITVLAVDDSQDILFALSAICELEGWRAITTTEGNEVLTLMETDRPDIVLVDYHMPRMDGIEVVRSIRAVNPHIPILVLTIESARSVADAFLAMGADDFALKPVKPVDLISRIRVHLRTTSRTAPGPIPAAETASTEAPPKSATGSEKFAAHEEYVKGISPFTLAIVCRFLQEHREYLTINEISAGCGLAYQTTYRYLTYLVGEGSVLIHSEYGRQGRPKQKYRWKR